MLDPEGVRYGRLLPVTHSSRMNGPRLKAGYSWMASSPRWPPSGPPPPRPRKSQGQCRGSGGAPDGERGRQAHQRAGKKCKAQTARCMMHPPPSLPAASPSHSSFHQAPGFHGPCGCMGCMKLTCTPHAGAWAAWALTAWAAWAAWAFTAWAAWASPDTVAPSSCRSACPSPRGTPPAQRPWELCGYQGAVERVRG